MSEQEQTSNLPAVSHGSQSTNSPLSILGATDRPPQFWTSLVGQERETKKQLARVINGDTDGYRGAVGETLEVCGVTLTRSSVIDGDTGEIVDRVVTCLHTPESRSIAGMSAGVARGVYAMWTAYGPPPWAPPIVVTIRQRPLGDGKSLVYLDIEGPAEFADQKKKK